MASIQRYNTVKRSRNGKISNHRFHELKKEAVKPIPIDLKPSGILTRYLHQTSNPVTNIGATDIRNKYSPPDDAVIPTSSNCHIHLFKYNRDTDKQVEIPLFNFKSYFIFGRDEELSDITIAKETEDGDLVSKQHAVLQFRKGTDDTVKCFLLDLGSTNGIFLNESLEELPKKRFIQLKDRDYFCLGDPESVLEFMIIEDK